MTMKCIGIDIGFGYTKTYDGEKIASFPTLVKRAADSSGFGNRMAFVTVDNERFYVGDDAKGTAKWYEPRTADFVGSSEWIALFAQALKVSNFGSLYKNALVLGLPASQYHKQKTEELIYGLRNRYIHTPGINRIDLKDTHVSIIPQGLGIFLKYIFDEGIDYAPLTIAIIDIGFYTIDLVTVYQGQYLNDEAHSHPLGISKVLDKIKKAVNAEHRRYLSNHDAVEFIKKRSLTTLGRSYKIENLDDMIAEYSAEVAHVIDNYMERHEFDIGIAGGGGIYVLQDVLKLKKALEIVDQPAESNAIGYWHYGVDTHGVG
ncbi:MAG: ParM/StbA family protein [Syntrophales bacterium]